MTKPQRRGLPTDSRPTVPRPMGNLATKKRQSDSRAPRCMENQASVSPAVRVHQEPPRRPSRQVPPLGLLWMTRKTRTPRVEVVPCEQPDAGDTSDRRAREGGLKFPG